MDYIYAFSGQGQVLLTQSNVPLSSFRFSVGIIRICFGLALLHLLIGFNLAPTNQK